MATSMQGHPTLVKFEASPQGHCTFRSPGSSGLQRRSALLRLTWLGSTQGHFEHIRKKSLTIAYLMHLLLCDAKETKIPWLFAPVELCTRGQESLPQLCALKKAHDLHDDQGEKINKHVTFLIILDVCFMFLNVFWCFLTFVGCLLKGLKETHLSSRSSHIASSTLSTLSRAWNSLMGQPHLGIGQTSSCGNRWGKRHLEPK